MRDKAVFTTFEAAKLCHVSPLSIINWVNAGRIPAFRTPGGHRRIRREDLARFMRDNGIPLPEELRDGTGRSRVLVVDDEPHIQHYMRATLEAWGHAVTVAPNGRGGLEQALATPFDVIISDLRMPELGGREMLEQLRAQQPAVADRVVISTGDTVRGDTLAFLESLGRPYLRKPFTLVELRAAIADAVRRTSEQR